MYTFALPTNTFFDMKATFTLFSYLFLLLVSLPAYSQNENAKERWDSESYVYSNFKYGFSWLFPTDIKWEKIGGSALHTVFKVKQPDTAITAYVNINKIESEPADKDIWDFYEKWNTMIEHLSKQAYQMTGEKTLQRNAKKCLFCGKRAIKQRYTSSIEDDRYPKPLCLITISYYFIQDWHMYSATIKMPQEVYEALSTNDLNPEDIFKGFALIPKGNHK